MRGDACRRRMVVGRRRVADHELVFVLAVFAV
jgi:hypothetical protein